MSQLPSTVFQCSDCVSNFHAKCDYRIAAYPIAQTCNRYVQKRIFPLTLVAEKPAEPVTDESFLYAKDDPKHCVFYSKLK